jgi:hypothetical protein
MEYKIRISEKDKMIFSFLNACNFATLKQVYDYSVSNNGFKSLESIRNRIYQLTNSGYLKKFSYRDNLIVHNTNISSAKHVNINVNFAKLDHTLFINNIYFYLKNNYPDHSILNENQIRSGMQFEQARPVGIVGKIPDLILNNFETDENIWVEAELNLKSNQRMEKILSGYKDNLITGKISGVYYFTNNNEVVNYFRAYIKKYPNFNIQIFFLNEQNNECINLNNLYNLG